MQNTQDQTDNIEKSKNQTKDLTPQSKKSSKGQQTLMVGTLPRISSISPQEMKIISEAFGKTQS